MHVADNHFVDIVQFLNMGMALEGNTSQQKKELIVCARNFSIIARHLYKMGADKILQRYVLNFEKDNILAEAHGGAVGGNYVGKAIAQKILRVGLWWRMLHKDSKSYCKS